jgi:hypothetical protein
MRLKRFCATAVDTNDGYTWTLTTRLGAILYEIEQACGPRDSSWTVLGVEFGPETPQLWYPGGPHASMLARPSRLTKSHLTELPAVARL